MSDADVFRGYIDRILSHEGGYVNHPNDPGGETKFGISKRSYPKYDIKNLTREQAIGIYYRDFWLPVVNICVEDAGLAFQVLDAAVNHGMGNACRFLQRAAGVADDGHAGPVTKAAVCRMKPDKIQLLFLAERFEFWAKLQNFDAFGRGWVRRGAQNLRYLVKDT
jgi:lysozyme family protein